MDTYNLCMYSFEAVGRRRCPVSAVANVFQTFHKPSVPFSFFRIFSQINMPAASFGSSGQVDPPSVYLFNAGVALHRHVFVAHNLGQISKHRISLSFLPPFPGTNVPKPPYRPSGEASLLCTPSLSELRFTRLFVDRVIWSLLSKIRCLFFVISSYSPNLCTSSISWMIQIIQALYVDCLHTGGSHRRHLVSKDELV